MTDLLLKDFDLHEFNQWMLNIQKASEGLNFVLKKIKEIGYEENTLNDWLKNPDMICKENLSEEDIDFKSINVAFLRKEIYRIHDWLTSYGLRPEDLFEIKNGEVFISEFAEHSYFMCNASYLDSGEEALSILYDICYSLMKLKQYGINLHLLQDLLVGKERYDVDMKAFEKFVESNGI